jgi:hypothetical protein
VNMTTTIVPAVSTTSFSINGSEHFPIGAPNIAPSLPAAFYTIEICMQRGPFFKRIEPMTLPPKLYGDVLDRAERIKRTFSTRKRGTTGVMLSGEKGSGKTLLGRKLAIDCVAAGMPVIVLNKPLAGDMLGNMLQTIGSPFVLFIDEFEKVYAKEHQEAMLTVLDGVFTLHMLAILTTNDDTRLVDPLLNRPGRIFYRLHYAGLTPDFVREFATDHVKDATQVDELVRLASLTSLNFDQLAALVEEMNRYGETMIEAIQFLNVDLDVGPVRYSVEGARYRGVNYSARECLTYQFEVNLFDGDPDEWGALSLFVENVGRATYKELLSNGHVRLGVDYGRCFDTRFSHDKYHSCVEDEGPSHHPYGLRVMQACKEAKPTADGLIEATFPTSDGTDVTLLLRRPFKGYTKTMI